MCVLRTFRNYFLLMFMFGIFHKISISHAWSSKRSGAWCRYQVKRRDLLVPLWGVLLDFVSDCRPRCRMRVFNIQLDIWKIGAPVRWMGGGRGVSWWERTGSRVSAELRRTRLSPPLRAALEQEAVEGMEEAESGIRAGRPLP